MNLYKYSRKVFYTLCLLVIIQSCKSEKETSIDNHDSIMTEDLIIDSLGEKIDSSLIVTNQVLDASNETTDEELVVEKRTVQKKTLKNPQATKLDNIQFPSKSEQMEGKTLAKDEKKYENTIKDAPGENKISANVLDKQSEKNEVDQSTNSSVKINTSENNQDIHNHELFDEVLKSYVSSSGKVNYKGLKSKVNKLDEYLNLLSLNPINNSWSRNQKMAYWINVYNAFTIKKVLDNYPLKSITDLNGGKVWDQKFIKLGNRIYSLNEIENEILRPTYNDARIHFAVNCAARSCPPLSNKAFTSSNLNQMLDRNTKDFINDSTQNKLSQGKASISKIFDWYSKDFGDTVEYLNRYSNMKIDKNAQITYMNYDWSLNE